MKKLFLLLLIFWFSFLGSAVMPQTLNDTLNFAYNQKEKEIIYINNSQPNNEIKKSEKTMEDYLLNYGVLGIFAMFMIFVIKYQEKNRQKSEEDKINRIGNLEKKLDELTIKHINYVEKKEQEAFEIIKENSNIFKQLMIFLQDRKCLNHD